MAHLTSLQPFRSLGHLRREMDRMWDDVFEGMPARRRLTEEEAWFPALDMSETKDSLIVKAELPGIDPKDVNLTLQDHILTIRGERKAEKEEKNENFHLKERTYGSFFRSVELPYPVKDGEVKASFKNGVLTITMPKSEEAKEKKIEIKLEESK